MTERLKRMLERMEVLRPASPNHNFKITVDDAKPISKKKPAVWEIEEAE